MEYEDIGSNIVSKYYEDPEPKQTGNINIMSATGISQKIPLQEGYSMCEYCGCVGRSETFFSKSKRFCSCVCSRSYSSSKRDKSSSNQYTKNCDKKRLVYPKNSNSKSSDVTLSDSSPTGSKQMNVYSKVFEWGEYLDKETGVAAPVTSFKHCPLFDFWQNIIVDMKLEVVNTDTDIASHTVYWISSVKAVAGYKAKVRYEGFADDSSKDFWVNLSLDSVHAVGWCAANGHHLVPPKCIQDKHTNWKEFLVNVLTGAWTLPQNFHQKVIESCNNWPLGVGMNLEVVDKMCLSIMKIAVVDEIKGGRLRLRYVNSEIADDYFWCHSLSSLIHPVGWSQLVGHKIEASSDYKAASLSKATFKQYHENDATPDMFLQVEGRSKTSSTHRFQAGMKLEAVDPLNLGFICVATVVEVLRHDYIMVRIDGLDAKMENETDAFCYHTRSPYILPVGFCKINNIELTAPKGCKMPFNWFDYLRETKSIAAPVELFDQDVPKHGYKVGMKVEAVDLMDPRLICAASISDIVGRLMKIHFDDWEVVYDQWIDCQSPDIYPAGWCEIVGHRLEAPRSYTSVDSAYNCNKKRNKGHPFKGGRKKKRLQTIGSSTISSSIPSMLSSPHSMTGNDLTPSQVSSRLHAFGELPAMNESEKKLDTSGEMPRLSPLNSASDTEMTPGMPELLDPMQTSQEDELTNSESLAGATSEGEEQNLKMVNDFCNRIRTLTPAIVSDHLQQNKTGLCKKDRVETITAFKVKNSLPHDGEQTESSSNIDQYCRTTTKGNDCHNPSSSIASGQPSSETVMHLSPTSSASNNVQINLLNCENVEL